MAGPITPEEAEERIALVNPILDAVFEAFNELIVEGRGVVLQDAAVERVLQKMPELEGDSIIFRKKWLDVEPYYRAQGWNVRYERPSHGVPWFTFTRRLP